MVFFRRPSHRAAYRFYRMLNFQTWLLSTKMETVWKHSNLPVMFTTWIWAVCANLCGTCELSSCAFNCLSKQMLIIRANVWRLIDALTEANYSFQQGI